MTEATVSDILVWSLGLIGLILLCWTAWISKATVDLRRDMAVIRVYITKALDVEDTVKKNREWIIRYDERFKKHEEKQAQDLKGLHDFRRKVEPTFGGSNHG